MASLDIQDAYLHIPLHPSAKKFLCFKAGDLLYEFNCLPFGLNIAPLVFTSVLKVLIQKLRIANINILAYLDDLILWESNPQRCEQAVKATVNLLQDHGFLIHHTKSAPIPSQQVEWLGFHWDSVSHTAALTSRNARKIQDQSSAILAQGTTSRSELESLFGRLAFEAQFLPNIKYLERR